MTRVVPGQFRPDTNAEALATGQGFLPSGFEASLPKSATRREWDLNPR
jgi:hypothetical protein